MPGFEIIARIHTDFPGKFGIPRQSGLVGSLKGTIVFEEKYRDANALRGIETYSHLWLIWLFSLTPERAWSPTVKPPRLGGNRRMGVFATRSPFRPNPIGLSCVRLDEVLYDGPAGPRLLVSGVDMADGTPILDIKPYLPYADAHPEASGGFTDDLECMLLKVEIEPRWLSLVPFQKREALLQVLRLDPRPGYRHDSDGLIYGLSFAGLDVRFTVSGRTLTVIEIVRLEG